MREEVARLQKALEDKELERSAFELQAKRALEEKDVVAKKLEQRDEELAGEASILSSLSFLLRRVGLTDLIDGSFRLRS